MMQGCFHGTIFGNLGQRSNGDLTSSNRYTREWLQPYNTHSGERGDVLVICYHGSQGKKNPKLYLYIFLVQYVLWSIS